MTLILEPTHDLIIGGQESPDFRTGDRHIPMSWPLDFALRQGPKIPSAG